MKNRMRRHLFLLASSLVAGTLVSCVAINKTPKNMAVYDFGLSLTGESHQKITSNILIEKPVAVESLNQNTIRYRLNYQNPSRVFFYTESRWATTPSELLASTLSKSVNLPNPPKNCSLKIQIEAFDHVFQTETKSEGTVQLSALLVDKKSQMIISSQHTTESVMALSPNAKGGAMALQQASEIALKKVINWGNTEADRSQLCR